MIGVAETHPGAIQARPDALIQSDRDSGSRPAGTSRRASQPLSRASTTAQAVARLRGYCPGRTGRTRSRPSAGPRWHPGRRGCCGCSYGRATGRRCCHRRSRRHRPPAGRRRGHVADHQPLISAAGSVSPWPGTQARTRRATAGQCRSISRLRYPASAQPGCRTCCNTYLPPGRP